MVAEAELIRRSVDGRDAAAFGELVRRHQSRVRSFARQLCREASLADDLSQDSFMQAWDKLHTFGGKGALQSWLLSIVYRTFLQRHRSDRRYAEVLGQFGQTAVSITEPADSSDLEQMLAVLSEEERVVMILAYGYGMSHSEIHRTTGLATGTVKSHIHRGKAKIRSAFAIEEVGYG